MASVHKEECYVAKCERADCAWQGQPRLMLAKAELDARTHSKAHGGQVTEAVYVYVVIYHNVHWHVELFQTRVEAEAFAAHKGGQAEVFTREFPLVRSRV